jgi:daunorubicin resistance ABC transporter membrane protein
MTALSADARVVSVLVRRDLLLFIRQRSRIVGALAQPLLLWLAIGAGIAPSFRLAGNEGIGYMEYFFPGILVMLLLQNSISGTMSVIEDRHQGFLQGVLVAPGSRASVVVGKCVGTSAVSLVQAALFLILAPLAGFPYGQIAWLSLFVALALTSLALGAMGFAIAWWLDSTTGYHVVMSLVLFPLWILSGAVFPPSGLNPVLGGIVAWNPMTYAVSWTRRAMHGGTLPSGTGVGVDGMWVEVAVVAGSAVVLIALAAWACNRKPPAA